MKKRTQTDQELIEAAKAMTKGSEYKVILITTTQQGKKQTVKAVEFTNETGRLCFISELFL